MLSMVGNILSPLASINGHPAFDLIDTIGVLSTHIKQELDPRRILCNADMMDSPDYQGLHLPTRSAYEDVVMNMLQTYDLNGTGKVPLSVIRNCLISGNDVKGIKPGMVDVIMALLPVAREPITLDDPETIGAYGELVLGDNEYAVDVTELVPLTFEPLVMLLRWAWLFRCASHKIQGMDPTDYMTWTDLMVSG